MNTYDQLPPTPQHNQANGDSLHENPAQEEAAVQAFSPPNFELSASSAHAGSTPPPLQLTTNGNFLDDVSQDLQSQKTGGPKVSTNRKIRANNILSQNASQSWQFIHKRLQKIDVSTELTEIKGLLTHSISQITASSTASHKHLRLKVLRQIQNIGNGLELLVKYIVYKDRIDPSTKGKGVYAKLKKDIGTIGNPAVPLSASSLNYNLNIFASVNTYAVRYEFLNEASIYNIDPRDIYVPRSARRRRTKVEAGGASVEVSSSLKKEDKEKLKKFLERMKPGEESDKKPKPKPSYIPQADLLAILKVLSMPEEKRDKILKELEPSVKDKLSKGENLSIADAIAHAEVKVNVADFREKLPEQSIGDEYLNGSNDFTFAGERTDKPKANYPVQGRIHPDQPISPNTTVNYWFEEENPVDDLKVPRIHIQWRATHTDASGATKVLDKESVDYLPRRGHGVLNDKKFGVRFPEAGTYTISALIHHNNYRGHQFLEKKVQVEEESDRLAATDAANGIAVTSKTGGHQKTSATDYGHVDEMEATITPKELAKLRSKSGLPYLNRQVQEITQLLYKYQRENKSENADAIAWAKRRLAQLQAYKRQIYASYGTKGHQRIAVSGVYASGKDGMPDTNLKLSANMVEEPYKPPRGNPGGPKVKLTLNLFDQTELESSNQYAFEETAIVSDTQEEKEKAYNELWKTLFNLLKDAYPNGSIRFFYEKWDGEKLTGSLHGFQGRTNSVIKDATDVLYSDVASFLVNAGAGILSVFPPTAPVGIGISLLYNGSEAVYNLNRDLNRGTTGWHNAVDVGSVILDMMPVLGKAMRIRGHRFLKIADKTLNAAGSGYLFTDAVYKQLQQIQNGSLKQMMALEKELKVLSQNKADPALLKSKMKALKALKEQVRYNTIDVFVNAAGKQLLTMASQRYIQHLAQGKAGELRHQKELMAQSDQPMMEVMQKAMGGGKVPPIIKDPALGDGDAVRVYFEMGSFGQVRNIVIRTGANVPARTLQGHADTVKLLQKYQGVSGMLHKFYSGFEKFKGKKGSHAPGNDKLFIAEAEVSKLTQMVNHRRQLLANGNLGQGNNTESEIKAEIAQLEAQLKVHQKTLDEGLAGLGQGYIASEDTKKKKGDTSASATGTKAPTDSGTPPSSSVKDYTREMQIGEPITYPTKPGKPNQRGHFQGIVTQTIDGKPTPMVKVIFERIKERGGGTRDGGINYLPLAEFNKKIHSGRAIRKADLYHKLINDRPDYAPDQVMKVWNAAKDAEGKVYNPYLIDGKKVEIKWDGTGKRDGIWDMGHRPNKDYKALVMRYCRGEISYAKLLQEYQNPANYYPELPGPNRGQHNTRPENQ